MSKIWIQYDDTPERLPIQIAKSAEEMSKLTGVKSNLIRSAAHMSKLGYDRKFAVVRVEDEGEDGWY